MEYVWILTVTANVCLAILLVWRGHYIRYGWLTATTILAIFAEPVFRFVLLYHPAIYPVLYDKFFFFWIPLNGMVVLEAWKWRNCKVEVPVSLQILGELVVLLAQKGQFLLTAYYIECTLTVANLAVILWFIYIFRKEPAYDR